MTTVTLIHKRCEVQLSKDGGNTWYHYNYVGGYVMPWITDDKFMQSVTRRHLWLQNDQTQMRVTMLPFKGD